MVYDCVLFEITFDFSSNMYYLCNEKSVTEKV